MTNPWQDEWISPCKSVRLILGACEPILAAMPVASVPAVVSDPPYGIGEAAGRNKRRNNLAVAKDYGDDPWDNEPASPEAIEHIRRVSDWQVLFGGNFFHLPPSSCWLVWDKLNSGDFADCELCWTNLRKAVRRIQFRWNGMIRDSDEERVHPTQKPVEVMRWCIGHLPEGCDTILDPYMGSGTTLVAAMRMGKAATGIEREPRYFDIAKRRIIAELNRAPLFAAETRERQAELFESERKDGA